MDIFLGCFVCLFDEAGKALYILQLDGECLCSVTFLETYLTEEMETDEIFVSFSKYCSKH